MACVGVCHPGAGSTGGVGAGGPGVELTSPGGDTVMQHLATTLDQVLVTLGRQVAQQHETNTVLCKLLPQAGAMEPAASAAPVTNGGGCGCPHE